MSEQSRCSARVAVVQSSYVPWKGYFDIVAAVDHFVLLDDVQYTRRDWRNRNRIKTPDGLKWLTIPVQAKGNYHAPIDAIEISGPWADRHWRMIVSHYRHAPAFAATAPDIEALYAGAAGLRSLSAINRLFIEGICRLLGIGTELSWSRDHPTSDGRTDRLLSLCKALGAGTYLSGPSARAYLDEARFAAAGIEVEYMDYGGYPEYPQLHGGFEHAVSILDLLFNTGADAPSYMKHAMAGSGRG